MTDDAVRYVRSGMVRSRIESSDLGPWVAWVPGSIAGAPPRS